MRRFRLKIPSRSNRALLLLGVAALAVTFLNVADAAEITGYDVRISETDEGNCYRDYSQGGRIGDNCPVQLEISLVSQPGLRQMGQGGIPTVEEVMALAQTAQNYPSTRITVPSIRYGGGYSGPGRMKDKRGLNDRCMFTRGLSGIDCYDGTITITEFTPQRLVGRYRGTLYRMNDDQKTFTSTSISGRFDIPMPALHDKRRPAGVTYQEQFREAFNLMSHMKGAGELSSRLSALRDDGRGGAVDSGPPCDCSCAVHVRWQNWQVGKSCAPICTLPEWQGKRCDLECGAPWAACVDLARASPELSGDIRQLVEAMALKQGASSPSEYRAIEDLVGRMQPEQREQLMQLYGIVESTPSSGDVEKILDHMVGENAPEGVRAAMRPSIEQMAPEERAKILESYGDTAGQSMAASGLPTGKRQSGSSPDSLWSESQASSPYSGTGVTSIPVNPDWDAETLRYKAKVEQLGMTPDITEDAIEMFFNNKAPMRETLWENIEQQLARKQGTK